MSRSHFIQPPPTRQQDPELAAAVLDRPAEHMMPFAEALREVVARVDPTYAKETASNAVLQVCQS